MFKLSCFHTSTLSAKQRKTVQLSSEPLQNTAEDCLQSQVPNNLDSELTNTMVKGFSVENFADHATDSCAVEFDEETESKNSIDRDILARSSVGMKKCHSLGCFLNRNETGNVIPYEDEVKESYSDESHDNLGLVDRDDELSCEEKSGDNTPRSLTCIVKSVSLPYIASLDCSSRLPLFHSRSAEDLQVLDSRQKLTSNREGETSFLKDQEDRSLVFNEHGGDNIENPIDYSAKDLVVPAGDEVGMENDRSRDPFKSDDLSSKDFTKKRIEEWVLDLQECCHLEASSDLAAPEIIEVEKYDSYTKKEESKVNSPSMEAARKYISSLPSPATSAQLINLGLVTIPFLSPISSLRALNLSGNAIVRITAGALPRGLHVLNLSKNNIATIEGLRDLTRLRVLDLSYNRILRIGHGLASCSSLKELYLAGNKISEVEGLHRLLKLNFLDLRFNKISTTKCLGQLAANYLTLQVISLEGNPAQKNVGDEQLKKYLLGLLPNLVYFNRKPIKVGSLKDRLNISVHQNDRTIKADVKNVRKGMASSSHVRKSQPIVSAKPSSSSRRLRLASTGGGNKVVVTEQSNLHELSNKLLNLKSEGSVRKSRSVGNLAEL